MADFTDNPEYRALLAAVCGRREEDTPRLVLADWLEEHGQADRAEFVRVQVELAALDSEQWPPPCSGSKERKSWRCGCRPCTLRRRERELVAGHVHHWLAGSNFTAFMTPDVSWVPPGGTHPVRGLFTRGFVSQVTLSAADWLAHADALAWHPEHSTDECKTCGGRGKKAYVIGAFGPFPDGCPRCDEGHVPRPCPPTAQPIGRVVLTTVPVALDNGRLFSKREYWLEGRSRRWLAAGCGKHNPEIGWTPAALPDGTRSVGLGLCKAEWPGIEFEVRGGNIATDDERQIDYITMVRVPRRRDRRPNESYEDYEQRMEELNDLLGGAR